MWEVSGSGSGCQSGYRSGYEAMTPQCGISVVQVLVVRVDIGAVIYDDTPVLGGLWFSLLISD